MGIEDGREAILLTTQATAIRDAIFVRLSALPGYARKRKTPVPQLQPDDLPALSVFLIREQLNADGDANAGDPHFLSLITIGIASTRGFNDPVVTDGKLDADVDLIENKLLTDASFVHFGLDPPPLFEGVQAIVRTHVYAKDGETYFAEARLELTFVTRVDFQPVITDDYEGLDITVRPLGSATSTPPITIKIDET